MPTWALPLSTWSTFGPMMVGPTWCLVPRDNAAFGKETSLFLICCRWQQLVFGSHCCLKKGVWKPLLLTRLLALPSQVSQTTDMWKQGKKLRRKCFLSFSRTRTNTKKLNSPNASQSQHVISFSNGGLFALVYVRNWCICDTVVYNSACSYIA